MNGFKINTSSREGKENETFLSFGRTLFLSFIYI